MASAYPASIAGIVITAETPQQIEARFAATAGRETVEQLVDELPESGRLHFYDAAYPKRPSDPGIYFTVERVGDEYTLAGGNHGWSVARFVVERATVVALLWACRVDNSEGGPGGMTVHPIRNRYATSRLESSADSELARYVRERTAR